MADVDKEKEVEYFKVKIPSREGQIVEFLWRQAIECYNQKHFLATVVLGGILAEVAHRAKVQEKGMENFRDWGSLIKCSAQCGIVDQRTRELLDKIRKEYRNPWIHLNLKEIENYAPLKFTDAELTVASKAAKDASEVLYISKQLISWLYPANSE